MSPPSSQNNDEICKQINVCPSTAPLKFVQVKLPKSDAACDVCKEVVPYLRKLADSSMVEVSPRSCVCTCMYTCVCTCMYTCLCDHAVPVHLCLQVHVLYYK